MRTPLITLLLVGLLVSFATAQRKNERDGADPRPNVPPYPGSGPDSKTAKKGKPPELPLLNETYMQRELDGYQVGQPAHADAITFCQTVSKEIKSLVGSGRKIEKILVTGFADGIPNKGINYDLSRLPSNCEKGIKSPVDDPELALLRGCVVLEQLSEMLEPIFAGGISWRKDKYDEPDGGHQGSAFRKVRIEIFMRKK
jgi:hypothetical protein